MLGNVNVINNTAIIGQNGWADAEYGDYDNCPFMINDSVYIIDLYLANIQGGKYGIRDKMREFSTLDCMCMDKDLQVCKRKGVKDILVLTHVPPFRENCLYNGKISDDNWLPYFSSKYMGDLLLWFAEENPGIKVKVLCGHTHSDSYYKPLDNLEVFCGGAKYTKPSVQSIIDI